MFIGTLKSNDQGETSQIKDSDKIENVPSIDYIKFTEKGKVFYFWVLMFFKVLLIVLVFCYFIYPLFSWVNTEEKGLSIQPFKTTYSGNNQDDRYIAQLLSHSLQNITEIDDHASKMVLLSNNPTRGKPSSDSGQNSGFSVSGPNPSSESDLSLKGESVTSAIIGIGTMGTSGTTLSIGNLLLSIKEINQKSPSVITGSLKKYGSTLILVANLEQSTDRKILTWEVKMNITKDDNNSVNEQIPSMIDELAFRIYLDLLGNWRPDNRLPQKWETSRFLITGEEALLDFNITRDKSKLNMSREMAIKAMQSEPNYDKPVNLLQELAYAFLSINNSDEAENISRNIGVFHPVEGNMSLGMIYLEEGKYNESLIAYENVTNIAPTNFAAWLYKGHALYEQRNYNDSLKAYEMAILLKPDYVDAWNGKGNALSVQSTYNESIKAYNEAIKAYDEAIELDPNYANAWYNKGLALYDHEKYPEAIKAYDEAIELDPNYADAWNNKGLALAKQENYGDALKAYDEAIRLNPNYAKAWYNKGFALDEQGNYGDALRANDMATRLDPKFTIAWYNEGVALYNQSKYDDALKAYDEAIRLNPNYAKAWYNKGVTLGKQGKYDDALKAYDEAIRLNPNYAYAWYNKGVTLGKQGKYDDALKAYERATVLAPNDADAWNNKGNALEALGKTTEADAAFAKAKCIQANSNSQQCI
jgi:tetratricopeptide (TPR) repeat protein